MNTYKAMFGLDDVELKVVRIFILAFMILLVYQTLQFINTRRIDKKHHELLVIRNESVGEVQNLLIQSSIIQRKLLNMALSNDPAEIAALKNIIETAAASNDRSIAGLEKASLKLDLKANSYSDELKQASDNYRIVYSSFIDQIYSGKLDQALEYRNTDLRPAYETYQEVQQYTLVRITDDLIRESNRVSSYTTTSAWILFFLGLAPFIYAIAKLIYLSVFLNFKSARISSQHRETDHKT